MTPVRRWAVVALLAVVAIGIPLVVRAWPAGDSDVSAADLLARVQGAAGHPYSGYVESTGTVKLPVSDQFSDLGGLFGESSQLRVWWQSDDAWRVDRLETTGESDLVHDARFTTSYDYADAKAAVTHDPSIRLPRASDIVPPQMARIVLDGVTDGEVSRIDARRVAGIDAPGLRIDPASDQTTIDHVDLWADPASGVPLRVDVYGDASSIPAFSSSFDSFSSATPDDAEVAFNPSSGVEVDYQDALDIADAANQYAPIRPPDTVAGLARTSTGSGAVGVYGGGVTRFLAVPLRGQDADVLRQQLAKVPDVKVGENTTSASAGPLDVLVTGSAGDDGWLVTGTVTVATLQRAADDLIAGSVYLQDGRAG